MEFTEDIVNAVNRLSTLEKLLDFDKLWKFASSSGVLGAICYVSLGIAFFTTLASILRSFYQNGGSFQPLSYLTQFIKMMLVTTFFCVPPIYIKWSGLLAGISSLINKHLSADILFSFQVQFRSLLYSIQSASESSGAVTLKTSSILNLMLSCINNLTIAIYFFIISIGPAFLTVAMLVAPLCMAISLFMPGVAYNWAKYFLASLFFSVIVSIGILSISNSGIVQIAADYTFGNTLIMALTMMITVIMVLSIIPMVIATVFHVHLFNYISHGVGILLLPLGLFPILLKSVATSKILKKTMLKIVTSVNNISRRS
jgi:hypothetical protein